VVDVLAVVLPEVGLDRDTLRGAAVVEDPADVALEGGSIGEWVVFRGGW
jgi:hypothetical protein